MYKIKLFDKILIGLLVLGGIFSQSVEALAGWKFRINIGGPRYRYHRRFRPYHHHWRGHHRRHYYHRRGYSLPYPHQTIFFEGYPFYYYDGIFFTGDAFGGYIAVEAPVGAVVFSLPIDCTMITHQGIDYYYYRGVYYRSYGAGYKVVPPP